MPFAGAMSGTSLDGVDAVVVDFAERAAATVLAHHHCAYPAALRARLLELQQAGEQAVTVREWALLDQAVSAHYVEALRPLAQKHPLRAIGMHGQTVFHDPAGTGNSLQIGNPNRLVAALGIAVVADFRRADIAEGGQGAPLVPGFHRACFRSPGRGRAVVNIGGIANLTRLGADDSVRGHDVGPGNALMDEWTQRHRAEPFDADGQWARTGHVHPELLAALKADPWFAVAPPRSTGRDQFSLRWVEARADALLQRIAPADVQRTLLQLTADLIAEAINTAEAEDALVCGGGACNPALLEAIQVRANVPVASTDTVGFDPMHVEAAAFAWLAKERLEGRAAGLPSVTGARRSATLGALYLPA